MKRFLFVLSAALTLPALSWAQGGCRGAPPATYGAGCYGAAPRMTFGSGCVGTRQTYGCQGFTAGYSAGCRGGAPVQMGFPAASYERYERYDGAATLAPPAGYHGGYHAAAIPVGRGAPVVAYSADPRNYGAGAGVTYGAALNTGEYYTPTGRPAGPGVLGVPGAGFPFDGPIRRAMRGAAGYDPGPARGTVRAGWVR